MLRNYVTAEKFERVCARRGLLIQREDDGTLLAFAGEEYMGNFDGKEGFLLDDVMVVPEKKYVQ